MCSRYRKPKPRGELIREFIESKMWEPSEDGDDVWPGGVGPILTNADGPIWKHACFGMMPHWAKPTLYRSTYNARSETVAEKPSFRAAWKKRQFCLIPVVSFFEPCYESGKAVPWKISHADREVFTLAGIWEHRFDDQGPAAWSFSMLTINADDHPLMRRFHKPEDEKRSVVVISPSDREALLNARTEADARGLLQPFDAAEFVTTPTLP